MNKIEKFLSDALEKRQSENALRKLNVLSGMVDFCSNDYLGFARSALLRFKVEEELKQYPYRWLGSTGSRLLTGNSEYIEALEEKVTRYHKSEAGLIFNSGYNANMSILAAIPGKNDTILYDELVHASIHDGIRLSMAKKYAFRHNDLADLEKKLKKAKNRIFVVAESVYSMDGDSPDLNELVKLAEKYNAEIILDEAHATGIFGKKGEGLVSDLKLEKKIFLRMHTFGKALGCHGAIVLGTKKLIDFLINFARPFIYTTALPFHSIIEAKNAYDMLSYSSYKVLKTRYLSDLFKGKLEGNKKIHLVGSKSAIQSIIIPGSGEVKSVASAIQKEGFDVRPILSPTVPEGRERLRICLHAFNTEEEVIKLTELINNIINQVAYQKI